MPDADYDAPRLAEQLRGLARDSHARAVLAKAFREAPMANAAEALHALADGLEAGTILRPSRWECTSCHDGRDLARGWECSGCGRLGDVERDADATRVLPPAEGREQVVPDA